MRRALCESPAVYGFFVLFNLSIVLLSVLEFVLLFFKLNDFAASSLEMTHQIYARLASFLFFFKMFLKTYLFDTVIVVDNERIPISVIFCMLTGKIVVA